MTDIFVYGVLMFKDIREALFGVDYETIDATLHGYARKSVEDLPYPALVEDEDSEVHGFILKAVSLTDTTILDKFEDEYQRTLVQVHTKNGEAFANTYIPKPQTLSLTTQDWNPEEFTYVEFYLETVIPEFFNNFSN